MLFVCTALIDDDQDKVKFEEFYHKFNNVGLHYAYSLLGDKDTAQDAVSEAFLRLAKCFQKVNNSKLSEIRNYFVIIIRNVCTDMLRKESRQVSSEYAVNNLREQTRYYDNSFLKYDETIDLRSCLERLTPAQRDILYLRHQGNSFSDISKMLGISPDSARCRYITASKRLKALLEQGEEV